MLEADGMERTYKYTQAQIQKHVDVTSSKKVFELNLDTGPYHINYTRNGRFVIILLVLSATSTITTTININITTAITTNSILLLYYS